jgi:5-methylcytosine-specific restriction endonuclease McrA
MWNKRKHECENCGKWLGKEPLSYMFDHLLEKSKFPELKHEEDNIMLVCLECHDLKTRGFITDFVRAKIEEVRKKFDK